MAIRFEWDPVKAEANQRKHGIGFEEAATIFGDPMSLTIADQQHSEAEPRFITVGSSVRSRLLVVVHTDRDEAIRIISARVATRRERRAHEEEP
jgi:hypothetical protein